MFIYAQSGLSQSLYINQTMNINQANAEKFLPPNPPNHEQKQQQHDPIQELNPISLLKKPDQFKQAFFSMACISGQSFKAKNYERAALALNKCVDMLDLGRNILKQINRFWKLVVYANLACCYHYTRKLSKCNKFCEKIKDELDKILSQSPEKEVFLKLSRVLIKLKFQHCAILSQLQMHQKAFELCKSTLPMLKQVIQTLLAYVQSNSTLQNIQKKSSETVQFSRHVHRFAQNLLTDLLKSLNQPLKSKQKTVFYYWQKNPQQNEEQVKKKFIPHADNNNCKRSILGVSKSSHWIDQFNIGTIMHFSQMNINDFDSNVPIQEYLFKDRLYELVIYCSMANFTMATQLRLIESTQQEKAEGGPASSPYSNLMKKYGYQQKSELFKMSEVYHLRSIDIMARNIKITVPYLTHIIRSYQKHYIKQKKVLQAIAAIVEQSALSLNESLNEKRQKQEEQGQQYYQTTYKNYINKNHYNQDQNEYNDAEPIGDLLLQSQNYQPQQLKIKKPEPELEQKQEKLQDEVLKESKGSMSPVRMPKQPEKKLISVKSDNNILRDNVESPKDDLNTSGEYLKSHKNKSTSKMKKIFNRQKSSSKLGTMRSSNLQNGYQTQRISKNEVKQKPQRKGQTQKQKYNDYKLKGEKADTKKQKQRKTIKKQKLLDFDNDKYGQKQIKIKTQSCTHIKVFYKKKK